MGIGVSNWRLARAVARAGMLGVVSGTALNSLLVRRLQQGDPGGELRRALDACPLAGAAQRVLARFWIEGGLPAGAAYRTTPMYTVDSPRELVELTIVAAFVEVFLAKEGHDGVVGINLLEKLQLPALPTLYGAMLADVDCVLVGAGIPRALPGILDRFAAGLPASLKIDVAQEIPGAHPPVCTELDPGDFAGRPAKPLRRPQFLAIVSSSAVATALARKASGRVDGFVVEGHAAGGHNAPPRGGGLNENGEPQYGPRDEIDLAAIRALGRPFWLAGAFSDAAQLRHARAEGAQGVQMGTAFAFCEESGLDPAYKRKIVDLSLAGAAGVFTDPRASPTGMPFKVVSVPGTLSEAEVYEARARRCDLGYLRQPYRRRDGSIGYRCAGEPRDDYVRKEGDLAETEGRKCLCNGLLSAVGLGQKLGEGEAEPAIFTAGEEVTRLARFCPPGKRSYSAADVLRSMSAEDSSPSTG
jgi:nitronate monooxygenase